METVYQGLKITTNCDYIKFTEAREINIYESETTSALIIEFPRNFKSCDLIDSRLECIKPTILKETNFIKVSNPEITLNGLKLIRLTPYPYTFSQFITDTVDHFRMNVDEFKCEILIPATQRYNIPNYLKLIGMNPYLKITDYTNLKSINNFNLIRFVKSEDIRSTNEFIFKSGSVYTKYRISDIDYLDSFIKILSGLLLDRGLELIRLPIDKGAHSVHRVTYRVTEYGHKTTRNTFDEPLRFVNTHTAHIDFKLTTPNLAIYDDFKSRYQNLDYISNFRQWYTEDKFNHPWIASAQWSPLDTSFNQEYAQDEQGNVAHELAFSADLDYNIVFDEGYKLINEVIMNVSSDKYSSIITI